MIYPIEFSIQPSLINGEGMLLILFLLEAAVKKIENAGMSSIGKISVTFNL